MRLRTVRGTASLSLRPGILRHRTMPDVNDSWTQPRRPPCRAGLLRRGRGPPERNLTAGSPGLQAQRSAV